MTIRLLTSSGSLEGGGSERQLWQLACSIDRDLFLPYVYLLRREGLYLNRLPRDVEVVDFQSQSQAKPGWGRIHRAQVRHLESVLRMRRIQVVYDRTFHMTMITAPACRSQGVARVSTIVSPPGQDFVAARERFSWLKKWLLARAYRSAARDSHVKTLAVSEAVAQDARQFYKLPVEAVQVMPSPVHVGQILELAAAQKPWPSDENHAVVVGRLSHEKAQATAIRALPYLVKRLPQGQNFTLNLIGDGPDRGALEAEVAALGLREHVCFRGFQENPYPFIASANALIIPSLYEGLPNVALEAMALGTPVIATRCSPSLEQLLGTKNERGCLIPVEDSPQLASELSNLFENSSQPTWKARIQAASKYVEREHDLEVWLQKMQDLFREVASAAPARKES